MDSCTPTVLNYTMIIHPLPPRPAFTGHPGPGSQPPLNIPPRPPLSANDSRIAGAGSPSLRDATTLSVQPRYYLRSHQKPTTPAIPNTAQDLVSNQGVLKRKRDATEDEGEAEAKARKAVVSRLQEEHNEATRAQKHRKEEQDHNERKRKEEARARKAAILEKRKHNPNNQSQSHVPTNETVSTRTRSKITYDSDYVEDFYINPRALANLLRPHKKPTLPKDGTANDADSEEEDLHENNKRVKCKAAKGVCLFYVQEKCTRHPSECNYTHPTGALFLECAKALEDQVASSDPAVVLVRSPDGKRVCHKYLRRKCHKKPEKCRFSHPTGEAFKVAEMERAMEVD
ncbi:hypothetical protein NX059_007370 [Plenodomus lindquistii]|nr:hypothetical protein NX059_007370 [Plenodomus lindquistii]